MKMSVKKARDTFFSVSKKHTSDRVTVRVMEGDSIELINGIYFIGEDVTKEAVEAFFSDSVDLLICKAKADQKKADTLRKKMDQAEAKMIELDEKINRLMKERDDAKWDFNHYSLDYGLYSSGAVRNLKEAQLKFSLSIDGDSAKKNEEWFKFMESRGL